MSPSHSSFRRSVFCLLFLLPGVCAAQQVTPQFVLPLLEPTGGEVVSMVTGDTQNQGVQDILYINAPTGRAPATQVTVGVMLDTRPPFTTLPQNQITFPNVSNVVAALADFNDDKLLDYAFALTPTTAGSPNLCIYFGTGNGVQPPGSYNGGGNPPSQYPPAGANGGLSGCTTIPITGTLPPDFAYIATLPFKSNSTTTSLPQIVIEDSANNEIYVIANGGLPGFGGGLPGYSVKAVYPLPSTDGAGPIYVGDFNGDGNTDFIVNGQNSNSATVYFGDGAGGFAAQPPIHFAHNIHSMLMHDMDGDGTPDMVVEGDAGIIEIHHGKADGTFAATSEGGTAAGLDGLSGNGGHLAAIDPVSLNILTTTPIGLSVLTGNGSGNYALQGIYNIGPGRSAFALQDFFGTGKLDLAVNSPEGVAIARSDGSGGFLTSHAYAALAPALGAVVGFNFTSNYKDVVVNTGAVQAQLLVNNGNGIFNTFSGVANTSGGPAGVPANLWSNIVTGDFNSDGISDIAYSLTGLPLPSTGSGLYVQFGNGDGTFQAPVAVTSASLGAPSNNTLYGESAVGGFVAKPANGGEGIVNVDGGYVDTLLGLNDPANQNRTVPFQLGLNQPVGNTAFSQVTTTDLLRRPGVSDLVVQEGAKIVPYLNQGDNIHFTAMPALAGTPSNSQLVPAQILPSIFGNDQYADIAVLYYSPPSNPATSPPTVPSQLYIWKGNGDGTFATQPQVIPLSRNYYLAAVADMNSDRLQDIILSDGSLVSILYGQSNGSFGKEQHFLAGQGINSLTLADVNGDFKPDLIVANGGATISNALALGGTTQASIRLTPNADVNTGGITVLMNNILTQPVNGTLTATPEPSAYQGTFTLTAVLTPTSSNPVPTGTVQFAMDGTNLGGPVTLVASTSGSSSTASYTVPLGNTYPDGVHPITAFYGGDTANSSQLLFGPPGTHAIAGGPTTTTLYLCVGPTAACPSNGTPNPIPPPASMLTMSYGQTWNGTWDITDTDGGPLPGMVDFYDVYNGVSGPAICSVANVANAACPPGVGVTIGTGIGTNVITGVYEGDTTHTGSTSSPVTINVLQDTTTAILAGAPNPSPQSQPVTLTATFTGNYAAPIGTVEFDEFFPPTAVVQLLGTATLVPGSGLSSIATFVTSALPVGTDTIGASYAATQDFAAASATTTETITPLLSGSFTLSVTPNPITAGTGFGSLLTVTVNGQNGFAQPVNLTCGNLPLETSCSFVNSPVAPGGQTTLIFFTTAPHSCGSTQPYFNGSNRGGPTLAPFTLPALAGLLVAFFPGKRRLTKRRWLHVLVAVIAVAAATQIIGCGNCTDLGTRPGTYTFQVVGTATGTSEVQSQTVTLNVTI